PAPRAVFLHILVAPATWAVLFLILVPTAARAFFFQFIQLLGFLPAAVALADNPIPGARGLPTRGTRCCLASLAGSRLVVEYLRLDLGLGGEHFTAPRTADLLADQVVRNTELLVTIRAASDLGHGSSRPCG